MTSDGLRRGPGVAEARLAEPGLRWAVEHYCCCHGGVDQKERAHKARSKFLDARSEYEIQPRCSRHRRCSPSPGSPQLAPVRLPLPPSPLDMDPAIAACAVVVAHRRPASAPTLL